MVMQTATAVWAKRQIQAKTEIPVKTKMQTVLV
jgi:hypothetical protein